MTRLLLSLLVVTSVLRAEDWPVWRGPRGDGTSAEKGVPLHWTTSSNLAWKASLPGVGHASPIVWRDQIFTVAAVGENRVLFCIARQDGRIMWQATVLSSPLEKKHTLNSFASSTPATDGASVYTAFLDRDEMVVSAHDLQGKLQWQVRPGPFSSMHGFCSSPILFKDKVIVNGDHDGDSYLVALARTDGKTLWKTPRANHTRSYCVPIIRELSGRTQMILSGDKCVASYDPNNGRQHWVLPGPTEQFVASVVYNPGADLLFVTGGFPDLHILGLRHDGTGTIGESSIAWRANKGVSYVPSPISEGDYFLVVSDGGVACCYRSRDGKLMWQERLGGEHHASLVSAEGLVHFLSDRGVTTIVRPGPDFEVVAKNELGEKCFASPAISQGQIFIRSDQHLFAIGLAR